VHARELTTDLGPARSDGLPLTQAALRFAAERHEGQLLAGERAPFVQHPLEVAGLLSGAGYPDEVVACGVLHDVLETTDTPAIELEDRFGPRIAALVQAVTEDNSISDRSARKAALREQVARSPLEASAVFAADKVSRARELRSQLRDGLSSDAAAPKLDHYRASLAMLQWRLGRRHPLVEQLRTELDELGMLIAP
jgi:(p)ppGpp synthase/HD superfamily hydrolase